MRFATCDFRCLVGIACALGATQVLRADTIWVGSGSGGELQIKDARISRIENGQIYFTASGNDTSRDLSRIVRLQIDSEPALNAAEEALFTGKLDQAVNNYQRTVRSTNKPWVKD
ncbi:MAG: hypothetical protein ACREJC_06260, partial [Tepidisphaeraceae bacterium]